MRISDWSSDVCSSNLPLPPSGVLICAMSESVDPPLPLIRTKLAPPRIGSASVERRALLETLAQPHLRSRSEERRVGKEGDSTSKSRLSTFHEKKKHTITPLHHNTHPYPHTEIRTPSTHHRL